MAKKIFKQSGSNLLPLLLAGPQEHNQSPQDWWERVIYSKCQDNKRKWKSKLCMNTNTVFQCFQQLNQISSQNFWVKLRSPSRSKLWANQWPCLDTAPVRLMTSSVLRDDSDSKDTHFVIGAAVKQREELGSNPESLPCLLRQTFFQMWSSCSSAASDCHVGHTR